MVYPNISKREISAIMLVATLTAIFTWINVDLSIVSLIVNVILNMVIVVVTVTVFFVALRRLGWYPGIGSNYFDRTE